MEGIPLRLLLSLFLAAVVLSLSFYSISVFQSGQARQDFADTLVEIKNTMESLSKISDYGSFTKLKVVIPQKCSISFDNITNKMNVNFFGELLSYNASGKLMWQRGPYNSSEYEFEFYYGDPTGIFDPANEPYLIPFS